MKEDNKRNYEIERFFEEHRIYNELSNIENLKLFVFRIKKTNRK